MLAKNLSFLAQADAAGIVLGARVPIVLTSRADSVAHPHGVLRGGGALCRRPAARSGLTGGVSIMDTILVVNAGSSSLKFQVFAIDCRERLEVPDQGPDGRHRHAAAAARRGGRQASR